MSRLAARLRRLLTHPALAALTALAWLVWRSGSKPTRLAYPCQRAALGTTTLFLGLPVAHGLIRLAHRLPLCRRHARPLGAGLAALALAVLVEPVEQMPRAAQVLSDPPPGYTAQVFVVDSAGPPAPDRHPGVDALLRVMTAGHWEFYRSAATGETASPMGIVGAEDVVLVKINQQWAERGGTNTDVLRGILRCIVEHPDGFTGEIVVLENTQHYGSMDWAGSNAEDPAQSAMDVVTDFAGEGWSVSGYLLDPIRMTSVSEYAEGDDRDGYVVNPIMDPESQTRVSYPKFRTPGGARVSLRDGIWNPDTSTYDDTRLTFINVPVLKCHAIYGVTASVKNHMGTMTTALSTNAHGGVRYGGCGSFLAEVRLPDLNILDAIYVQARPGSGPACTYEQASYAGTLVAAADPVALDVWATAHVLVPAILANGFDSYPAQDPLNPTGIFRTYLDRSMNELLAAGKVVTNDLDRIQVWGTADVEPPAPSPPPPHVSMAVPNPFRTTTTLIGSAGSAAGTVVDVFDAAGRRVRRLIPVPGDQQTLAATWDGRDEAGRPVASGRYVYWFRRASGRDLVSGSVTYVR